MIKNVFFDLDGTLIDTAEGVFEGLRMALKEFGYEEPDDVTLRKCIGPPFSYTLPNILHVKDEDLKPLIALYRKFYDQDGGMFKCEVYDGIEWLLAELVKRGYSLNVCSSKPEPACKKLLNQLGLDKYFSEICGSSLDGTVNTKEDVIELCFKRAPWKLKTETLLIGDTKYDAIGAKECDIQCLGISWGFGSKEELLANGAVDFYDSCEEVLEYIEAN